MKRHISESVLVRALRYSIERKQAMETLRNINHRLETRIEQSTSELSQAKAVNQLKSEFVSMLSHDIRNPLNTILLSMNSLQTVEQMVDDADKLTHIRAIRSAINNVTQLLDEVSVINNSDLGTLSCHRTCLNLPLFCQQLIDEMELTITGHHQLYIKTQGDFNQTLWDKTLLWQIFSNLLTNAIKYSPDGGSIWFEVWRQGPSVVFMVRDQGIGIPCEEQNQLFQPFHRASNIGTIPGSGLGLAIVKRCVDAHGGTIQVQSEPGTGSTFTVVLPVQQASSMD